MKSDLISFIKSEYTSLGWNETKQVEMAITTKQMMCFILKKICIQCAPKLQTLDSLGQVCSVDLEV